MLSFVLLLFVKDFSPPGKWIYIGFIILLTIITIFRIKESQKEWYEEFKDETQTQREKIHKFLNIPNTFLYNFLVYMLRKRYLFYRKKRAETFNQEN